MILKNKEIYKTEPTALLENCVVFTGFSYKRVGNGDMLFGYVDCAGESQVINVFVADSPIGYSEYELETPLCVRENSVYKISGGSVAKIYYGTPC